MLFVGLQFLVWSLSGLYMVLIDIHSIHGESFALKPQRSFSQLETLNYDIADLLTDYPAATHINLSWLADKAVYRFQFKGIKLVDASSGRPINTISKALVREIALASLVEEREIRKIELIIDDPPSEIGSRSLPLWRVDFVGVNSPSLYIDSTSGELLSVRQNTWRIFDLLWRLHIMDYYEGEDINNILLNIVSISGFLAALFGLILLGFRLFKVKLKESVK